MAHWIGLTGGPWAYYPGALYPPTLGLGIANTMVNGTTLNGVDGQPGWRYPRQSWHWPVRHKSNRPGGTWSMPVDVIETVSVVEQRSWVAWPVYWSAIWVGALASIALAIVFGLVGVALGTHELGTAGQITRWADVSRRAVVGTVFAAFLSAALGGWVAGKVAGIGHSEPAMLHGVITWLVATPLLLLFLALGAGNTFGGWYGGLMGSPAWMPSPGAPVDPNAAIIARNAALAALTALLLGLMGSAIGGWVASGEPMTLTYDRTRDTRVRQPR